MHVTHAWRDLGCSGGGWGVGIVSFCLILQAKCHGTLINYSLIDVVGFQSFGGLHQTDRNHK